MKYAIALGLAVCAFAGASAQAADEGSDPMGLKLMAQCKAASGGAALDRPAAFHETGTVIRDGKAGTYEMYGDLHALRTAGVHTVEGKFGGGGFDGVSAWTMGPDGVVVVSKDPADVREQRLGAYLTIGGFYYPDRFAASFHALGRKSAGGKIYDVVTVTPADALSADLWLDVSSHRVMRISAEAGGMSMTGEILEYRVVQGTWIGFKNHQVEGDHRMTQTLATYDYVPLDATRFKPPSSSPQSETGLTNFHGSPENSQLRRQALQALKDDIDKGLADVRAGRVEAFDAARIIEQGRMLLQRSKLGRG